MSYPLVLSCLSDPTRRKVFEALRHGPMSVGDIAARMPVSRPAVSQHLKALADAGLVSAQARGTARFYRIERDGLSDLRAWVAQFWDEPLARFKAHAENKTERKANVRRKD